MKKLNFTLLVPVLLSSIMIVSCSKMEDEIIPQQSIDQQVHRVSLPEDASQIPILFEEVRKVDQWLFFPEASTFQNILASLKKGVNSNYYQEDQIHEIISGIYSLETYYKLMLDNYSDENVDDYEFDRTYGLGDDVLAAVLNYEGYVQVADTLYQIGADFLVAAHPITKSVYYRVNEEKGGVTLPSCKSQKNDATYTYSGGNKRILGKKIVRNYGPYTNLAMQAIYYELKTRGWPWNDTKWKRRNADQINVGIVYGNFVEWYWEIEGPDWSVRKTGWKYKTKFNESGVTYYWDYVYGLQTNRICVVQYDETVHKVYKNGSGWTKLFLQGW